MAESFTKCSDDSINEHSSTRTRAEARAATVDGPELSRGVEHEVRIEIGWTQDQAVCGVNAST